MVNYKQLTAEEIRMLIMKDGGGSITEEMVDGIKGKTALVEAHKRLTEALQSPEVDQDVLPDYANIVNQTDAQSSVTQAPDYTDPQWEEFILSQLQDHEKVNGYPKVAGLRRLTEKYLGEIVSSGPVTVTNVGENANKAIVTFQVTIAWTRDLALEFGDVNREVQTREFRAVASSWHGNTNDEYVVYPEAIAETRAEARALRRALRISKVSSDELTTKDTSLVAKEIIDKTNIDFDKINDIQRRTMEIMCDRLNVDLYKFINSGTRKYDSIESVGRETAAKMIQRLNEYQSLSVTVPETILRVKNED